jgi:hypothetical protein
VILLFEFSRVPPISLECREWLRSCDQKISDCVISQLR